MVETNASDFGRRIVRIGDRLITGRDQIRRHLAVRIARDIGMIAPRFNQLGKRSIVQFDSTKFSTDALALNDDIYGCVE